MSNHGTAYTIGQSGEIGGNIIRALPKALKLLEGMEDIPPQIIIKYSQEGERLSCALAVMFKMMYNGHADIAALMKNHYIDCNTKPFLPNGWSIEEHQLGGRLKWDREAQKDTLLVARVRPDDKIKTGNDVRRELSDKPCLNANVLDYLLSNPHLIPEEWKGKAVFFWGTIYRLPGGHLCVRCLQWLDGWSRGECWLDDSWIFSNLVVALRAS